MRPKLSILIVALVLILAVLGYKSYNSKQALVINYQNISKVEIQVPAPSEDPGKSTSTPIAYSRSGKSIRLKKGVYAVNYTGAPGYASGSELVTLANSKQTLNIKPDYSQDHLAQLLAEQKEQIHSTLAQKYPAIKQYSYTKERLISYGEWYIAVFKYNGSDYTNSDDLKAVLHKQGGVWVVATSPPSIWLTTVKFPGLPLTILNAANAL